VAQCNVATPLLAEGVAWKQRPDIDEYSQESGKRVCGSGRLARAMVKECHKEISTRKRQNIDQQDKQRVQRINKSKGRVFIRRWWEKGCKGSLW
jgi:hypothetical protein